MVKAAGQVAVAVCDSTKFNRRSLSRIVPLSAIHCVITDKDLSEKIAETLRGQNMEVILVSAIRVRPREDTELRAAFLSRRAVLSYW